MNSIILFSFFCFVCLPIVVLLKILYNLNVYFFVALRYDFADETTRFITTVIGLFLGLFRFHFILFFNFTQRALRIPTWRGRRVNKNFDIRNFPQKKKHAAVGQNEFSPMRSNATYTLSSTLILTKIFTLALSLFPFSTLYLWYTRKISC